MTLPSSSMALPRSAASERGRARRNTAWHVALAMLWLALVAGVLGGQPHTDRAAGSAGSMGGPPATGGS